MSDIKDWSNIADGNQAPPPDGFPEGTQSPDSINDCTREMMAAIRRKWEDAAWFDWGDAISYVSSNSFNASGVAGLDARYGDIGRRIRIKGTLTGTVYGSITDWVNPTCTVKLDSGTLNAEDLEAALSIIPAGESAIPLSAISDVQDLVIPVGTIIEYAGPGTPPGRWLLADGNARDAVSNPELEDLYDVILTTYGGTGKSNFFLPERQARFGVGEGNQWSIGDQQNSLSVGGAGGSSVLPAFVVLKYWIRY